MEHSNNLLDGKAVAQLVLEKAISIIQSLSRSPRLNLIQVGEDPASSLYVQMKCQKANSIGIHATVTHLSAVTHVKNQVAQAIQEAKKTDTDGIMIQLPLPRDENTAEILDLIPAAQDVDGLRDNSPFAPAVVTAVLELIRHYRIDAQVPGFTVIGQGDYVGKPLALALATTFPHHVITILDEFSKDPINTISQAHCIVSCVGKPHIFDSSILKQGAYLIDVGTSKHPETQKIVGDFSHQHGVSHLRGYTPVPGGIGPITVASLLLQVALAARHNTTQG